ncbi:hypothetical protein C8R45DRAFT_1026833 [Mycena sanguinolenta]|nr:hypothetical protein C8R45DRAFT_1026833 [Mycena sanguinolenta]
MPFLPRQSPEAIYLGVSDLGGSADLFLQGVLYAQLAHYSSNANVCDPVVIKLFVAGLAVLTTLKSIQTLAVAWIGRASFLAGGFHALTEFWWTNWLPGVTIIFEAVITFYVQTFFCYRLWALSHNIYIVAIVMAIFVVALAAAGVATYFFGSVPESSYLWYATHVGVMVGGDVILTGGIVFYLLRHSKHTLHRGPTAFMLNSLLRLTIQSAAPATLCALVNFVTNVSDRGTSSGLTVEAAVSGVTALWLPKFYAVAAMWTLNSREEIRLRSAAANELATHFDLQTTTSGGTSDFIRTGMPGWMGTS